MSLRELADNRFAAALAATGARDPRDFYRDQLKQLKERDPAAFRSGSDYFERKLLPAVAAEGSDPIAEWLDFGCFLAELQIEGSAIQIDPTGRASAFRRPVPIQNLVLHLPTSARETAIPIGLPPELSPSQRATFDLLVRQKVSL